MADPLVKKISLIPGMTDALEATDEYIVNDISEQNLVNYTKRLSANGVKIFVAAQLVDGVVENSKIKDDAVTYSKMQNVTGPSVIGRANAAGDGAGDLAAITAGTNGHVLKRTSSGTLAFEQVTFDGLAAGAVIAGKIATGGVSAKGQIANDIVDSEHYAPGSIDLEHMSANSVDSDQYVDGSIDEIHLANDAVTEAKLGAIKRTVAIPIFGLEDDIFVKNFSRVFAWPPSLNNHIVTAAHAAILGAVSSSGSIGITLTNQNGTMSTISIGAGAWSASAGSINSSYRTAQSFASFSVNVTAAGSGAKGLTIFLEVLG